MRRPIVGVMGSGSVRHEHLARPLGKWLASIGVNLLTGGGSGVMESVSRAFVSTPDRSGVCIGVLPRRRDGTGPPAGYPNEWVEVPIQTHLPLVGRSGGEPLSRNHLNVLSSDVIVALPGSWGTSSEVQLAARYERPVVAFVENRSDIPGLDSSVPALASFAEIQDFVKRHLQAR